jgi:hypothetical protein
VKKLVTIIAFASPLCVAMGTGAAIATLASIVAVPTKAHAQSDYPQRMMAARNDVADCCLRPRPNFLNPQLQVFWEAWRRAKGNRAVVPDLSEEDLAYLNVQLAGEWKLRGVSPPRSREVGHGGPGPAPYNPSLMSPLPFVFGGPANTYSSGY